MTARIIVLFAAPPPGRPGSFDLVVPPGSGWAAVQAAVGSALPGESVLLPPGDWEVSSPLVVPPGVQLWGTPGGTTLRTGGRGNDPSEVVRVGGDGVVLGDLRLVQARSAGNAIDVAASVGMEGRVLGFTMVGCELESTEVCLSLRAEDWWVEDCDLRHAGHPGMAHWHVEALGSAGVGVIRNCRFECLGGGGAASDFLRLTSRDPGDSFSGVVSVVDCSLAGGSLGRFVLQDSFGGAPGGFELVVRGNSFGGSAAGVLLLGGADNFCDLLSSVSLEGNEGGGGRGILGFDASSTHPARSVPLPVHLGSNALDPGPLDAGWSSLAGSGVVASSASVGSVPLVVDSFVRPPRFPPS